LALGFRKARIAKQTLLHKVAAAMLYRFFDIGNPAASGHLLIRGV
jgi:hypothetical protein